MIKVTILGFAQQEEETFVQMKHHLKKIKMMFIFTIMNWLQKPFAEIHRYSGHMVTTHEPQSACIAEV
jgi:hypothetical protein